MIPPRHIGSVNGGLLGHPQNPCPDPYEKRGASAAQPMHKPKLTQAGAGNALQAGGDRVVLPHQHCQIVGALLEAMASPGAIGRADGARKGGEHVFDLAATISPAFGHEAGDHVFEHAAEAASQKTIGEVAVLLEEGKADGEVAHAVPKLPGQEQWAGVHPILIYQLVQTRGEYLLERLEVAIEGHTGNPSLLAKLRDGNRG